jgi:hypothetical protein
MEIKTRYRYLDAVLRDGRSQRIFFHEEPEQLDGDDEVGRDILRLEEALGLGMGPDQEEDDEDDREMLTRIFTKKAQAFVDAHPDWGNDRPIHTFDYHHLAPAVGPSQPPSATLKMMPRCVFNLRKPLVFAAEVVEGSVNVGDLLSAVVTETRREGWSHEDRSMLNTFSVTAVGRGSAAGERSVLVILGTVVAMQQQEGFSQVVHAGSSASMLIDDWGFSNATYGIHYCHRDVLRVDPHPAT